MFPAFFWGDPHIVTVDGKQYTFNGLGEYEYMLAQIDDEQVNETAQLIELQARTAKAIDKDGKQIDATVFVAFAGRNQANDTFHVALNTDGSNDSKHLQPYFKDNR